MSAVGGSAGVSLTPLQVTLEWNGKGFTDKTPLLSAGQRETVQKLINSVPIPPTAAAGSSGAAPPFRANYNSGNQSSRANIVIMTQDQLENMLSQAKKGSIEADNKAAFEAGTLQLSYCTYEGTIKNGKAHGIGKRTYLATDPQGIKEAHGSFIDGQLQGYGTMTWQNGVRYEGEFVDDAITGVGKMTLTNGTYIGYFLKGEFSGFGIQTVNGEWTYSGGWSKDKFHGYGCYESQSGYKYEGEYQNGNKHGPGQEQLRNFDRFNGLFKDDKRFGYGEYVWSDGNVYKGNWDGPNRSGQGNFICLDGYKYIGQWKNDKKHGAGREHYTTGQWFDGYFQDGLKSGTGTHHFINGDSETGRYVKGKEQGNFIYTSVIYGSGSMRHYNNGQESCCVIL